MSSPKRKTPKRKPKARPKTTPKGGRPPHEFSDGDLVKVELLRGFGTPLQDIAKEVGCSVSTLQRQCKEQLDLGKERANAKVAGKLFQNCMKGKETSIIWWEKTRAGHTDKVEHQHSGDVTFVLHGDEDKL